MFEEGERWSPLTTDDEANNNKNNKGKKKMKNKKRFSDEQIKSLELVFESEPKLEPRKKVQLARELGLHPRQVAIWFQNKRARWKSRQLERDFSILRSNYNSLSSRFDSLNKDKQSLLLQLHKLQELVAKSTLEGTQFDGGDHVPTLGLDTGSEAAMNDRESDSNTNSKGKSRAGAEEEDRPGLAMEEGSEYAGVGTLSDDGLLGMVEPACSSLTSDEDWRTLHPQALFVDRSTEWWDLPFAHDHI